MRRVPEIAIGALLATAIWAVVFVIGSQKSPSNEGIGKSETIEEIHNRNNEHAASPQMLGGEAGQKEFWYKQIFDRPTDWLLASLTGLLVLYTRRLYVATAGLWTATRKLVSSADETAERQLRAYIAVETTGVSLTVIEGEFYSLAVSYTKVNYGQTPAYDIQTNAAFRVLPFPLPHDVVIEDPERDVRPLHGVIAPTQKLSGKAEKPARIRPFEDRESGSRLYLIMLITYRDAFGKYRRTEVCGSIPGVEDMVHAHRMGDSIPQTDFVWAERYNNAT